MTELQTEPTARVVLASRPNLESGEGQPLITLELHYWRRIHPQVLTHRALSRNARSSRACPTLMLIDEVKNTPWGPSEWRENRRGMQPGALLSEAATAHMRELWMRWASDAAGKAWSLHAAHVHKEVANAPLEPYLGIWTLATAMLSAWQEYLTLRYHPAAQYAHQHLARAISDAIEDATSQPLAWRTMHLPYIRAADIDWTHSVLPAGNRQATSLRRDTLLQLISAARCARVSYRPFTSEQADPEHDLKRGLQMAQARPLHASPFEHVAIATPNVDADGARNFGAGNGWMQFRAVVEGTQRFFMKELPHWLRKRGIVPFNDRGKSNETLR